MKNSVNVLVTEKISRLLSDAGINDQDETKTALCKLLCLLGYADCDKIVTRDANGERVVQLLYFNTQYFDEHHFFDDDSEEE